VFEGLKARLEKLLADHTPPGDPRGRTAALHAGLLEMKMGVGAIRDALAATEQALAAERKQLEDAERRGRLAAQVPDPETVKVAEQFTARHRERIGVLGMKRDAQRAELELAERELVQLTEQFRRARLGVDAAGASREAAWQDIEAAGGTRPETDAADDLLRHRLDRSRMDAAVEAQLDQLKRKLKKE
jgi:hypothetical protein